MPGQLLPIRGSCTRRALLPIVLLTFPLQSGCDAEPTAFPEISSAHPTSATEHLSNPVPVIVPEIDDASDWFGQVSELDWDARSNTLFTLDAQANRVVEFTTNGELIAVYGESSGRGPEEVYRLAGFAFTDSLLVLLDVGNSKTLLYDRRGNLLRTMPVSPAYRDIAVTEDVAYFVPGEAGAVDAISLTTQSVRSLGARSDIPVECEDQNDECAAAQSACLGCTLLLSDTMLVVFDAELMRLAALDLTGNQRVKSDLAEQNAVLRQWLEEDRPYIEEANREAAGQYEEVKVYFQSPHLEGEVLTSAVVPSIPKFREYGYEYWNIDLSSGQTRRFRFPRRGLGFQAVGTGPVYALDVSDGGIYRLEMPDPEENEGS